MANYDLDYEGSVVQDILDTGKSLEDDGYIFLGTATPSTIPGTPTERVAYIGGPGTYNNFGTTVVVPSGSIVVITYSGSAWSKVVLNATLPVATTLGSDNTTIPTSKAVKDVTDAINNKLGEGYLYAGIATAATNPGTPTVKVFYLARQAGTYTNFGGLTLTEGVNILKYNGTAWSQEQLISIADIYKNPLMGYYECDTAGATAAKTVAATGYVLPATGGSVKIKMANRNTVANATLNINSTGAKPLFYNGQRAGVGNTWDTNEIVEVFYDGTNYQAYNVAGSNGDGVFDISAYNLTDGQPTPYIDLAAALGTNGEHVPQSLHKGGMSVKFIQGSVPSSDNKYVQYRLMAQTFSTTVSDWQGVDEVPTPGSDNLVKSGSVADLFKREIVDQNLKQCYMTADGKFGTTTSVYHACIPVNESDIYYLTDVTGGCRYAFATSDESQAGGNVPFVSGTSIMVTGAANTYTKVVIPSGCSYLLFNAGGSFNTKCYKLENIKEINDTINTLGGKIGDLLKICTKTTGKYIDTQGIEESSSNFSYYTYKIDGESKIYVKTKMQNSGILPAYVLFSTETVGAAGYISHVNWKSTDTEYEIDIPDNCKLIAINIYTPALNIPSIKTIDNLYAILKLNIKSIETISNKCTFVLEDTLIDGVASGTKINDYFIAISGEPTPSSTGTYYYKLDNKNYKKIYASCGHDSPGVAAIAFYNGEPDSSTLISEVPFTYSSYDYIANVPDGTTKIAICINSNYANREKITIIPDIDKYYDDINIINNEIVSINSDIESLENNSNIVGNGSAAAVKELINTDRPYYFSQGWSNEDGFSYLDERLSLIPEGKHFLIYTDIHLDYYGNYGLSQKQSIVMKYVQQRLRDCNVIFLGDFIGVQSTELSAQKEMSWFANDNYSKFGDKFIPVLGDHDTDRVSGGLPQGSQLTEEYIYETYFRQAHIYGAIQDKAVSVIDSIVFSDDATINTTKRNAWKNYMRMHFYKDDTVNKIRFISLQATGANFRSISNGYNTPRIQIPFVCEAIKTAPDDYDIVIVAHEYQLRSQGSSVDSVWEREMFKALTAFKTRGTYTIEAPYTGEADDVLVWNAVIPLYDSIYDYSFKTGKVVTLQGDEHFDCAGYYNAIDNDSNSIGFGYEPSINDILRIFFDRATLVDNNGFPSSTFINPLDVIRRYRRAVAQTGETVLLGTTNEILFDVVTINENGLTLTRFGDQPVAGRIGLYPIFNEEESYAIGDKIVYYETINNSYFPKAYTFISAHSAGAFNLNEVEEFIVTEPYIRNYTL